MQKEISISELFVVADEQVAKIVNDCVSNGDAI